MNKWQAIAVCAVFGWLAISSYFTAQYRIEKARIEAQQCKTPDDRTDTK